MGIWFCPRAKYEREHEQIHADGWEIVGYSEFNSEGIPRIVELKKKTI